MLSPLAVSFLEPNIDGGQLTDILLTSSRDFLLSLSFFLSLSVSFQAIFHFISIIKKYRNRNYQCVNKIDFELNCIRQKENEIHPARNRNTRFFSKKMEEEIERRKVGHRRGCRRVERDSV